MDHDGLPAPRRVRSDTAGMKVYAADMYCSAFYKVLGLRLIFLAALLFTSWAYAERLLGVNAAALPWVNSEVERKAIVDAMANAGVKALRTLLVPPFDRTAEFVRYANESGIQVVLVVPLTLKDFYTDPSPRPARGRFPAINKISQLDTGKFLKLWGEALGRLEARRGKVLAFQIGTEFNSAQFNGDLPILGAILTQRTANEYAFWPQYQVGMKKLYQTAQIVSASLKDSNLNDSLVVLGAFARPDTGWLISSGNTLVEPNVALQTLLELSIDRYVDAYAVHVYPHIAKLGPAERRANLLDHFEQALGVLPVSKPMWITEWGFSEGDRLSLFCSFLSALDVSPLGKRVMATFIYDWNERQKHRVWDGKRVLGSSTSLFQDAMTACAR